MSGDRPPCAVLTHGALEEGRALAASDGGVAGRSTAVVAPQGKYYAADGESALVGPPNAQPPLPEVVQHLAAAADDPGRLPRRRRRRGEVVAIARVSAIDQMYRPGRVGRSVSERAGWRIRVAPERAAWRIRVARAVSQELHLAALLHGLHCEAFAAPEPCSPSHAGAGAGDHERCRYAWRSPLPAARTSLSRWCS